MGTNKQMIEPQLAKPGAGLPFTEWAVAKYIMLPRMFKETGKQVAIERFGKESEKLLTLVKEQSLDAIAERRLVPRLRGLEDSSRYWSIAMTLEHLIVVGNLTRETIVELSKGGKDLQLVGTADVKPNPNVDPASVLQSFQEMSDRFIRETTAANIDAFPNATHPHPWFGPFTAHKWLVLAGAHQNIHRRQIKEIIARL